MSRFGFWYQGDILLAQSGIFGNVHDVRATNAIEALTAMFYLIEKE